MADQRKVSYKRSDINTQDDLQTSSPELLAEEINEAKDEIKKLKSYIQQERISIITLLGFFISIFSVLAFTGQLFVNEGLGTYESIGIFCIFISLVLVLIIGMYLLYVPVEISRDDYVLKIKCGILVFAILIVAGFILISFQNKTNSSSEKSFKAEEIKQETK